MKGTKLFEQTIKEYLDKRAQEDELFAVSYAKENKSIEECASFIIGEVQKSGCNGFPDAEIFGMAVHYYDEDDIKDVKSVNCNVVVNREVKLTEEDIAEAKSKAIEKFKEQEIKKLEEAKAKEEEAAKKARAKLLERRKETENSQASLF